MLYIIIALIIIIGFLGYKLSKKQEIDTSELKMYQKRLDKTKEESITKTYELQTAVVALKNLKE